jgi:hypothetical protein
MNNKPDCLKTGYSLVPPRSHRGFVDAAKRSEDDFYYWIVIHRWKLLVSPEFKGLLKGSAWFKALRKRQVGVWMITPQSWHGMGMAAEIMGTSGRLF